MAECPRAGCGGILRSMPVAIFFSICDKCLTVFETDSGGIIENKALTEHTQSCLQDGVKREEYINQVNTYALSI